MKEQTKLINRVFFVFQIGKWIMIGDALLLIFHGFKDGSVKLGSLLLISGLLSFIFSYVVIGLVDIIIRHIIVRLSKNGYIYTPDHDKYVKSFDMIVPLIFIIAFKILFTIGLEIIL